MKTLIIVCFILLTATNVGESRDYSHKENVAKFLNQFMVLGPQKNGFDKEEFRFVVRDTFKKISPCIPYSNDAVELAMLTVAQESHFGKYNKQINGPANGIAQIEPGTEKFIWEVINDNEKLKNKVHEITGVKKPSKAKLRKDAIYNLVLIRVLYYIRSPKLPSSNNILAMAKCYKKYYNTYAGKGTVKEVIKNYRRFCV